MSAPSLKLCQQLKLFHSLEATLAQQVELNSQLGSQNLKVFLDWQSALSFLSEGESASSLLASILISEAILAQHTLCAG